MPSVRIDKLGHDPAEDASVWFEVLQPVTHPNRKGAIDKRTGEVGIITLHPESPPRQIRPGDYDLYGRVICWALEGKVRFVDGPTARGTIKATGKVG